MALLVGLTGNIACGKSSLGIILEKLGIPVLDSDLVVHELYKSDKEVQKKLLENFGSLDRKKIGKEIFGDSREAKAKRKILEDIIHPAVDREFRSWVKKHKNEILLVNLVPLLFEAGLEHRYDLTICLTCKEENQIQRLKNRDKALNEKEIKQRIQSQMPQKIKAQKANYLISNDGTLEELEEKVKKLLQKLTLS